MLDVADFALQEQPEDKLMVAISQANQIPGLTFLLKTGSLIFNNVKPDKVKVPNLHPTFPGNKAVVKRISHGFK